MNHFHGLLTTDYAVRPKWYATVLWRAVGPPPNEWQRTRPAIDTCSSRLKGLKRRAMECHQRFSPRSAIWKPYVRAVLLLQVNKCVVLVGLCCCCCCCSSNWNGRSVGEICVGKIKIQRYSVIIHEHAYVLVLHNQTE